MTLEMVPLDLIEPFLEGDWVDAFTRPFLESEIMPDFVAPTMVFAALAIAFYIYGDGLVLPVTFTIIFGGFVLAWVAGSALSIVVGVLIIFGALLFGGTFWLISRG